MNSLEYQRAAMRTLIGEPRQYTSRELMLIWNGMGLAGEATELLAAQSSAEVEKEMGDVLWYLAALYTLQEAVFPDFYTDICVNGIEPRAVLADIVVKAGKVSEIIKKQTFHDHARNDLELDMAMLDCFNRINLYCASFLAGGMSRVAQRNIDKLTERYPEGFSPAASAARADLKLTDG